MDAIINNIVIQRISRLPGNGISDIPMGSKPVTDNEI